MAEAEEYEFVCPECAQTIEVNAAMRDALLDNGCVICGASLSPAAFSLAGDGADTTRPG